MTISVIHDGEKYMATLTDFETLDPSISKIENEVEVYEFPIIFAYGLADLVSNLKKVIRRELEYKFSI